MSFGHLGSLGAGFGKLGSPAGGLITRQILTFNGINSYAELASAIDLTSGDTVQIGFATGISGTSMHIFGSEDANKLLVEFDAGDLLQLTNCTVTIDGSAVADGADISSYQDGKIHTIIATATGTCTITHIAQNGSDASYWDGPVLDPSVDNGVITPSWGLDSGSTLYELADDGSSLGSNELTAPNDITDSSYITQNGAVQTSEALLTFDAQAASKLLLNGDDRPASSVGDVWVFEVQLRNATTSSGNVSIGIQDAGGSFPTTSQIVSPSSEWETFRVLRTHTDATATKVTILIQNTSSESGTVEVRELSMKQLPDTALVFTDVQASDWEIFKRTYNPDAWTALDGSPVLEIV
jgi:hypothetical protein